jgi:hypothetical protein
MAPASDAANAAAGEGGSGGALQGPAIYSLPFAASHDPALARTFVAGLRAADHAITLTMVDDAGHEAFRTDVFRGVSWGSDAEVHVYAASRGAWVVFRGPSDGGRMQRAIFVDEKGQPTFAGVDVAPAHCALGSVLSVVHASALISYAEDGGATRRRLADPSADVSLMCDDGRLLLLSESEQGAFVEVPEDGGLRRLSAFNSESEGRTTALFSFGDRSGIVRVDKTTATVRELEDGGLSRSRAERIAVDEDDDIVVVDGVGQGPILVTTHESELACDAGVAASARVSVSLLGRSRVAPPSDAGHGDAEAGAPPRTAELAPAVCGRERGPFWSGAVGTDVVVAWGERVRQAGKAMAPVAGVGFARIRADGTVSDRGTIALSADGVVDAACDAHDCYAAALIRPAGDDDAKPEAVRVVKLATSP